MVTSCSSLPLANQAKPKLSRICRRKRSRKKRYRIRVVASKPLLSSLNTCYGLDVKSPRRSIRCAVEYSQKGLEDLRNKAERLGVGSRHPDGMSRRARVASIRGERIRRLFFAYALLHGTTSKRSAARGLIRERYRAKRCAKRLWLCLVLSREGEDSVICLSRCFPEAW